ncbi:aldehyde dehydrogenase family protein [Sphingomonas sp. YL-JM2C]
MKSIEIAYPERLFIGGEWVSPASDERLTVVPPSTEHPYFEVAAAKP